jgi:hypothetical protein
MVRRALFPTPARQDGEQGASFRDAAPACVVDAASVVEALA